MISTVKTFDPRTAFARRIGLSVILAGQRAVTKLLPRAYLIGLLALTAFPGATRAATVFSCPDTLTCNGNEYALLFSNLGPNTFQLTLDIRVLSTYTGNQWTDFVNAVEIQDFAGGAISNFSLVSAPGGVGLWDPAQPNELNANGCSNAGGSSVLCAGAKAPSLGAAFTQGDLLSWTFQFDSTNGLNSTAHIKYLYVDSDGVKVGDLGSWDIVPQAEVPEPVAPLLIGSGLVVLAVLCRRLCL